MRIAGVFLVLLFLSGITYCTIPAFLPANMSIKYSTIVQSDKHLVRQFLLSSQTRKKLYSSDSTKLSSYIPSLKKDLLYIREILSNNNTVEDELRIASTNFKTFVKWRIKEVKNGVQIELSMGSNLTYFERYGALAKDCAFKDFMNNCLKNLQNHIIEIEKNSPIVLKINDFPKHYLLHSMRIRLDSLHLYTDSLIKLLKTTANKEISFYKSERSIVVFLPNNDSSSFYCNVGIPIILNTENKMPLLNIPGVFKSFNQNSCYSIQNSEMGYSILECRNILTQNAKKEGMFFGEYTESFDQINKQPKYFYFIEN